jgi:hypothetical protein
MSGGNAPRLPPKSGEGSLALLIRKKRLTLGCHGKI